MAAQLFVIKLPEAPPYDTPERRYYATPEYIAFQKQVANVERWVASYGLDFPADKFTLPPGFEVTAGVPCLEGVCLGQTSETVRVMSDVWETEYRVKFWDGHRVTECAQNTGYIGRTYGNYPAYEDRWVPELAIPDYALTQIGETGSKYLDSSRYRTVVRWTSTNDATPEVLAAVAQWTNEQNEIGNKRALGRRIADELDRGLKNAIQRDIDVVVAKGRKVKVGTEARLTYVDWNGQYGPYGHLRTADGREFKFVNLANLRPANYDHTFLNLDSYGSGVAALARGYAQEPGDVTWGIFLDKIQDLHGDVTAAEVDRKRPR